MAKLDRKPQNGRYEALLVKHGEQELLDSFDALMREVAAKLERRTGSTARTAKRQRTARA